MNQHDTHKPATTQKIATQQHSQPGLEEAAAEPQAAEVAVDRADPRLSQYSASQQARMLQRMQRTIGNAQVQRMLSQPSAASVQRVTPPIAATATPTLPLSTPVLSAPVASSPEHQPELPSTPVTVQRAPSASPVITRITPVAQTAAPIARAGFVETLRNKAAEGAKQLAMLAFQKAAGAAGVDPRPIMGLLSRAGGLLGQLIKNPAPFANTLVRGVGQGFRQFGSNISAHLQSGFGAWLFGTMGRAGVSMPRDLSPSSVLSMVLQVLGVTPDHLKQRVAAQVGAKNVEGVQQAVGVLSTAMKGGLGGLWSMLKDELGDLKALVVDGIKDWLISSVIKAAVTKIASMFNPATGIVAAILSIANVIKFVVQRAGQIKALFQSVTDSVSALAQGNAQQLASKVEQTLARMVPLAIGLLSSLVGIGGIAGRVKQIISRVQSRVQSAIDKMIKRVADKVKGLLGRGGAGQSTGRRDTNNSSHNHRQLSAGLAAIQAQERQSATDGGITFEEAKNLARAVKKNHPVFQSITVVDGGKTWDYNYSIVRQIQQGTAPKKVGKLAKKIRQNEIDILESPNNTRRGNGVLKGDSTKLGSRLGARTGYQAHHVIPSQIAKESNLILAAVDAGYDQNDAANGILLPGGRGVTDADIAAVRLPRHQGSHPEEYVNLVRMMLLEQEGYAKKAAQHNDPWTEEALLSQVASIQNRLRKKLRDETDSVKTYRRHDAFKDNFGRLIGRAQPDREKILKLKRKK